MIIVYSTPRSGSPLITLLLLALITFGAVQLSAQSPAQIIGRWTGTIEIPGSPLDLVLDITDGESTYSIAAQGVNGFPIEKLTIRSGEVSFHLGGGIPGDPRFDLLLVNDNEMSGTFRQSGVTFDADFRREGSPETTREDGSANVPGRGIDVDARVESYLDSIRSAWNVPGIAVAVVVDGEEKIFTTGYRNLERKEPVTPSTRFAIGSTTKAFTATLIGMLVDEGLLEWDEPVITYLPDFELFDDEATARLRVRDLLTHVSGLPRHDLLWYLGDGLTREDLFSRLRYLEPVGPSGQEWRYQNLMYMVAGVLAERVTGDSWEELIEERIFAPLGMQGETSLDVQELRSDRHRAHGYVLNDDALEEIPYRSLGAIAPAGSINSSAQGILPWLQMNLLVAPPGAPKAMESSTLRLIQSPQVVMPAASNMRGKDLSLYGLGWMVSVYRGDRIVYHGGSIDGFQAQIALLPEEKTGVAVFTNRQSALPESLTLDIIDFYHHDKRYRHAARLAEQLEALAADERSQVEQPEIVEGTRPSREPVAYAGTYVHPAYDTIRVTASGDVLSLRYFGVEAALHHIHYDVFAIDTAVEVLGGSRIVFNGGLDGSITSLASLLEVSLDPIEFRRMADARLTDATYLRRFAGEYSLSGQSMEIRVVNGRLRLNITGQPEYDLIPKKIDPSGRAIFVIEGMEMFTLRFSDEDGDLLATFLQPNGTFVAKKKR